MNACTALGVLATALVGCSSLLPAQEEGCYAITPVQPSGVLRDECNLVADVASTLGVRMTQSGYIVDLRMRFPTESLGQEVDVAMAGRFDYGTNNTFSADGTAQNIVLPISGQSCQVQRVDVHLEGTTDTKNARRFSGLIRIQTSTPRPETCVCQAWFQYQAAVSSTESICP